MDVKLTTPQRIALDAIAFNPFTKANVAVLHALAGKGLVEPHPTLQPLATFCEPPRRMFFAGGKGNYATLTPAGRAALNLPATVGA
jgi:hypothetical protein